MSTIKPAGYSRKEPIKKGYVKTQDLANDAECSKNQIGDYRRRGYFEGFYYQDGRTFYYHLEKCKKAINDNIKRRNKVTDSAKKKLAKANIPEKDVSEAKKSFYQAEKARLEVEEKLKNLVDAKEIRSLLVREGKELSDRLYAIPAKLAPVLVGMTDVKEITELLQENLEDAVIDLFKRFIDD